MPYLSTNNSDQEQVVPGEGVWAPKESKESKNKIENANFTSVEKTVSPAAPQTQTVTPATPTNQTQAKEEVK